MDYSPPATSALALPTIYDQMDGRPNADFTECGCGGVVERVANDYDGYTGRIGYEYLNGCDVVQVTLPSGKVYADPCCAQCVGEARVAA